MLAFLRRLIAQNGASNHDIFLKKIQKKAGAQRVQADYITTAIPGKGLYKVYTVK